jgi:hypothetical protein
MKRSLRKMSIKRLMLVAFPSHHHHHRMSEREGEREKMKMLRAIA